MRKVSEFLRHNQLKGSNIQQFPYSDLKTSWWNANVKMLAYFIDPELGDDNNDGLSWSSALKTLGALAAYLPLDLQGYQCHIFLHPGTHIVDNVNFTHINGRLHLNWVGSFINSAESDYAEFVRCGQVNPIRSDDPTIILVDHALQFVSFNRSCIFQFSQQDYDKAWNQAGFCYWDKLIFKKDTSRPTHVPYHCLEIYNAGFFTDSGFTIDTTDQKTNNWTPVMIADSDPAINAVRIVGGDDASGPGQTTSSWRGAMYFHNCNTTIKKFTIGFADGFEPASGKQWEVVNYKLIINSGPDVPNNHNLNLPSGAVNFDAGVTGLTKPIVRLSEATEGNIKLDFSEVTLTDASTIPRVITDLDSGNTWSYISANMLEDGNHFFMVAAASAPSDNSLLNGQAAFYLDESGHNLKIKVKYSDGTVKTATVAFDA